MNTMLSEATFYLKKIIFLCGLTFKNNEFKLKALQNSKKIDSMVFNTTFAKN